MMKKALLAVGLVMVVAIVSGCNLKYISNRMKEGETYPVVALQFAGQSRSYGRDYIRFDLRVKIGEEEWRPNPFFVPWKIEKGDTTHLARVTVVEKQFLTELDVNNDEHFILRVSPLDGERIRKDVEKAIAKGEVSAVNAQVQFFLQ
ncbi:MAG: hypothetical protein WC650_03520 [Candidatus Doudnabacteria bacterium]